MRAGVLQPLHLHPQGGGKSSWRICEGFDERDVPRGCMGEGYLP